MESKTTPVRVVEILQGILLIMAIPVFIFLTITFLIIHSIIFKSNDNATN